MLQADDMGGEDVFLNPEESHFLHNNIFIWDFSLIQFDFEQCEYNITQE